MTVSAARPSRALAPPLALIAPVVVGGLILAAGVVGGNAGHYAPAQYSNGSSGVSSLGVISRGVIQAQKFALSNGAEYFVGRAEQLTLNIGGAGEGVYDWIAGNPGTVPLVNQALADANPPGSPFAPGQITPENPLPQCPIGDTITVPYYGLPAILTTYSDTRRVTITSAWEKGLSACYSPYTMSTRSAGGPTCNGATCGSVSYFYGGGVECKGLEVGYTALTRVYAQCNLAPNAPLTYYPPPGFSPALFKENIDALDPEAVANEFDKCLTANPGGVGGFEPWTSADSSRSIALVEGQVAIDAAAAAQTALEADPANTALQVAAAEAAARAAQAEVEAQAEPVEPLDLSGAYSPVGINKDYAADTGLNNISQFTDRFNSFIAAVKATSLFSLPSQVLFNIPNSSTSIYTINMGSYGTADLDFSSFGTALAIFRTALLICFGYAAIRIAATGK